MTSSSLSAQPRTKVAIVTDAWLVGGGKERVLMTLLTGIDRTRFEPVVFALFNPRGATTFCRRAEAIGVPVMRYDLGSPRICRSILEAARLFRDIRKGGYAAVHSSGDRGAALVAGRIAGVRVRVYTVHDTFAHKLRVDYLLRAMALRWFATSVVAVSRAVADVLRLTTVWTRQRSR